MFASNTSINEQLHRNASNNRFALSKKSKLQNYYENKSNKASRIPCQHHHFNTSHEVAFCKDTGPYSHSHFVDPVINSVFRKTCRESKSSERIAASDRVQCSGSRVNLFSLVTKSKFNLLPWNWLQSLLKNLKLCSPTVSPFKIAIAALGTASSLSLLLYILSTFSIFLCTLKVSNKNILLSVSSYIGLKAWIMGNR